MCVCVCVCVCVCDKGGGGGGAGRGVGRGGGTGQPGKRYTIYGSPPSLCFLGLSSQCPTIDLSTSLAL